MISCPNLTRHARLALSSPIAPVLTAYPKAPRLGALQNPYLGALVSAFVVDALFYVYHRLQHGLPWFWHIHKLHHTDPAMNITTAKRTHASSSPRSSSTAGSEQSSS